MRQELDYTTDLVVSGPAIRVEVGSRSDSASRLIAELVGWELAMVDPLVGTRTRGGTLAKAVKPLQSSEQDRVRSLRTWIQKITS